MLNDILFSFFLTMPAVVAVVKSSRMISPLSRAALFWGGLLACVLIAAMVIPMLACDGHLMSAYGNCVGGPTIASVFTKAQPLIILAAKAYILVCIPLGVLAFALDALAKRESDAV